MHRPVASLVRDLGARWRRGSLTCCIARVAHRPGRQPEQPHSQEEGFLLRLEVLGHGARLQLMPVSLTQVAREHVHAVDDPAVRPACITHMQITWRSSSARSSDAPAQTAWVTCHQCRSPHAPTFQTRRRSPACRARRCQRACGARAAGVTHGVYACGVHWTCTDSRWTASLGHCHCSGAALAAAQRAGLCSAHTAHHVVLRVGRRDNEAAAGFEPLDALVCSGVRVLHLLHTLQSGVRAVFSLEVPLHAHSMASAPHGPHPGSHSPTPAPSGPPAQHPWLQPWSRCHWKCSAQAASRSWPAPQACALGSPEPSWLPSAASRSCPRCTGRGGPQGRMPCGAWHVARAISQFGMWGMSRHAARAPGAATALHRAGPLTSPVGGPTHSSSSSQMPPG